MRTRKEVKEHITKIETSIKIVQGKKDAYDLGYFDALKWVLNE